MKNNIRHYLPVLLGILLLSSCTHYYYIPNAQNVPIFKEKNEFHLAGGLGTGNYTETTEFMGAYSVTDEIGVTANFLSAKGGDGKNGGTGTYGEAACGYYKPLNEWWVFETYGGLGMGKQHHDYSNPYGSADLNCNKYFIQPALGATTNAFDFIVALRGSQLEFTKITGQGVPFSAPSSYFLMEPSVTIRAGWKNVKLQLQMVLSKNTGESRFPQEEVNLNFSLYLAFANRFSKQKATSQ